MEFRIAETFTSALAKLPRDEQKAVKTSVFGLQTNPDHPSLQLHRVDGSKDPNFWSARVNRDIRIIVHKTDRSLRRHSTAGSQKPYGKQAARSGVAHF